jgi:hypothetical protein
LDFGIPKQSIFLQRFFENQFGVFVGPYWDSFQFIQDKLKFTITSKDFQLADRFYFERVQSGNSSNKKPRIVKIRGFPKYVFAEINPADSHE